MYTSVYPSLYFPIDVSCNQVVINYMVPATFLVFSVRFYLALKYFTLALLVLLVTYIMPAFD